ncbi:MAG TPA: hypothetical protein VFA69_03180 [Candidatus Nitrosotalea sp.]|nr:hypothetical protein [Candidatus Nitrosotalea sp.]
MKLNTIPVIVMILTSAMLLPVGLSYAAVSNGTMANQTSSNSTMMMSSNQTGMMNKTMTVPPSNSTMMNQTKTMTNSTVPQSNNTQAAMQVSTFIHQAVADFTQQGDDTRKVMLDCVAKVQAAAPSDIDKIKQDCSLQLNTITAKYQDERSHYHDLIKQYRQSVMVFLNDARGQSVPQTTMNSAISQLAMMMHAMPASPVMSTATNNTK